MAGLNRTVTSWGYNFTGGGTDATVVDAGRLNVVKLAVTVTATTETVVFATTDAGGSVSLCKFSPTKANVTEVIDFVPPARCNNLTVTGSTTAVIANVFIV